MTLSETPWEKNLWISFRFSEEISSEVLRSMAGKLRYRGYGTESGHACILVAAARCKAYGRLQEEFFTEAQALKIVEELQGILGRMKNPPVLVGRSFRIYNL